MDEDQFTAEQLIKNASALNDHLIGQVAKALKQARQAGRDEPIFAKPEEREVVAAPAPKATMIENLGGKKKK